MRPLPDSIPARSIRDTILGCWGIRHLAGTVRAYPAISTALALAAGLSLVCEIAWRMVYRDGRAKVFLLGDSGFCNYRLAAGERLEDQLESLLPGRDVVNFARPGARPMDLVLQYTRGKALAGAPDRVVVLLSPELLVAAPNRMDNDGENLRYLPLDADGLAIFRQLTDHERNVAAVQRISQSFLVPTDAAHELWLHWWKWPRKRLELQRSGPRRKHRIAENCAQRGAIMAATRIPSATEYDTTRTMRDVTLLMDRIRAGGVVPMVVILPEGNPDLIAERWSPESRSKLDSSRTLLRDWLQVRQIGFLDFNEPEWVGAFPGPDWDDMDHMRSPAAYGSIAKAMARELPAR